MMDPMQIAKWALAVIVVAVAAWIVVGAAYGIKSMVKAEHARDKADAEHGLIDGRTRP